MTDRSPKCVLAIENLQRTCEEHLAGQYQIEVVDLLENPRRAADDQILAVPTLVRKLPSPSARSSATCPTSTVCSSASASAANGRGHVTHATPILAGRSRSTSAARRHVGQQLAECQPVGIGLDGRGAPYKAPRDDR